MQSYVHRIQSVGKKPIGNNTMTPFHCAAINPNVKYLKELLSAKSEDRLPDSMKRQPIHYAAACTGPDPLKVTLLHFH
jgi:ankyrin repeat protein